MEYKSEGQELATIDRNENSEKTLEEMQYKQKSKAFEKFEALSKSNRNQKIYQSLLDLRNFFSQKKTCFPQIFSEHHIKQLIEIFLSLTPNLMELTLQLFNIIINLSDMKNNNIKVMIKNSFLDVIINFPPNIQKLPPEILLNVIKSYLKVIQSLISFSYRNLNTADSQIIIQALNPNFIFSDLYEFSRGKMAGIVEWLGCIEELITFHKKAQIEFDLSLFPLFLKTFKSLIDENDDIDFRRHVIETLSELIDSFGSNPIDWTEFVNLKFPQLLSELSMNDYNYNCDDSEDSDDCDYDYDVYNDYNLIRVCCNCICTCAIHGFNKFDFSMDKTIRNALNWKSSKMYKSLFSAFFFIASDNLSLIDAFFSDVFLRFLDSVSEFRFELKFEVAIFIASMLECARANNIAFVLDNSAFLCYLYQLFVDSKDLELLSAMLNSFVKIGAICLTLFDVDTLTSMFKEIVPDGFNDEIPMLENENDFRLYQLAKKNYPFLFGFNGFNDK